MSYGKVHSSFWTDDKIAALSDQAKLLAVYFLSSPHRNAIGCAKVPSGYIAVDLGWTIEGVSMAVQELTGCGFVTRDDSTGWTLINNLLRYDPIKGDKAAIGAAKVAASIPANSAVYKPLYDRLEPILEAELKGRKNVLGYPMQAPSEEYRSPYTLPDHVPEPVPEPKDGADAPISAEPDVSRETLELDYAVGAYQELAREIGLPPIAKRTRQRMAKLRARLADCGGLEGWKAALAKIRANRWMHGDNERGWKANFDFLLQESSFVKLMEGSYDHDNQAQSAGRTPSGKPDPFAAVVAGARRAIDRGQRADDLPGGRGVAAERMDATGDRGADAAADSGPDSEAGSGADTGAGGVDHRADDEAGGPLLGGQEREPVEADLRGLCGRSSRDAARYPVPDDREIPPEGRVVAENIAALGNRPADIAGTADPVFEAQGPGEPASCAPEGTGVEAVDRGGEAQSLGDDPTGEATAGERVVAQDALDEIPAFLRRAS